MGKKLAKDFQVKTTIKNYLKGKKQGLYFFKFAGNKIRMNFMYLVCLIFYLVSVFTVYVIRYFVTLRLRLQLQLNFTLWQHFITFITFRLFTDCVCVDHNFCIWCKHFIACSTPVSESEPHPVTDPAPSKWCGSLRLWIHNTRIMNKIEGAAKKIHNFFFYC
jgi:hypothetical protein